MIQYNFLLLFTIHSSSKSLLRPTLHKSIQVYFVGGGGERNNFKTTVAWFKLTRQTYFTLLMGSHFIFFTLNNYTT